MKNKYFHFFGDDKLTDIFKRDEIIAIKKMQKGEANEYEQKLVYKVIVEKLCRLPHSSFASDPSATSFNEGVRWVGLMLAQAFIANIDDFKENNPINNK